MTIRDKATGAVRSAFESLPESTRLGIRRVRDEMTGLGQMKANLALVAQRLSEVEQQIKPLVPHAEVEDPRFPEGVRTRLCTQDQMLQPWFTAWCEEFHEPPYAHRKTWEFAYIAEALDALGVLQSGKRGLGFGVGREPLVPAFAARGVDVVATDLDPESSEALGWLRSDQHADLAVESMMRPEVCPPDTFRQRVTARAVDMRAIPDDLRGFDFCWSACALEHLGTLDLGLEFIERSLDTLAPGGIAVHTTEYNLTSNDDTIDSGAVVIYRERDVRALIDRLEAAGHEVAALDLHPGEGLLDHYVDVPPYGKEPVLRFLFAKYTLTSVAFVIRARSQ